MAEQIGSSQQILGQVIEYSADPIRINSLRQFGVLELIVEKMLVDDAVM
jgi:hypothetical protein